MLALFASLALVAGAVPSAGSAIQVVRREYARRPAQATIKVLYDFKQGTSDGQVPSAPFVANAKGALFTTTLSGGPSKLGTVIELKPSPRGYKETVLHAFSGPDGASPHGALLIQPSGVIYGTTASGGDPVCQCGVIFALVPKKRGGYVYTLPYRFRGGSDGATPMSGLVADGHGTLYGTTEYGGSGCSTGCGTLYKYDATPSGVGYQQLIALANQQYVQYNGDFPIAPPTIWNQISSGQPPFSLLMLTSTGGYEGAGAVVDAAPTDSGPWVAVPDNYFGGVNFDQGANPTAGLVQISTEPSAFAGVTPFGGDPQCNCGVVYLLTLGPSCLCETNLHEFSNANLDGKNPAGELAVEGAGTTLFGVTSTGGVSNAGTAYELTYASSGWIYGGPFYSFGGSAGSVPLGGLLAGTGATLFGTASEGGSHSAGTAYEFTSEAKRSR